MDYSAYTDGNYSFVFGDNANLTDCPLELSQADFNTESATVEFDKTNANDLW